MEITKIYDTEKIKYKELIGIITSEGYELDWKERTGKIDNNTSIFYNEFFEIYKKNPYIALLNIGFKKNMNNLSQSVRFLYVVASFFVQKLSKEPDIELLRENVIVKAEEETIEHILKSIPFLNGVEYINKIWIEKIWTKLNIAFAVDIDQHKGSIESYFSSKDPELQPVGRVYFHLVESKREDYPFAFLATYTTSVNENGKSKHLPLKNALIEYEGNNKKLLELLSKVNKVTSQSEFISDLVETGDIFHPINLTSDEAFMFLKEIKLYEESGILCRIPNWWRNKTNSLSISVTLGSKTPSSVGFDSIVDFNINLSIGGETISIEEIKRLIEESDGLALIKGKWVEVNHEKLKETLEAYEKAQKSIGKTGLNMLDAIRFQLNASKILDIPNDELELEIKNGEWLNSIIKNLKKPENIEAIDSGKDFDAVLREYQKKGLTWLNYMKSLGLGACLADDMGLGKTIQIIALLNNIRNKKKEKTLIIVPASLIGNWMDEFNKFAPSLKYYILHKSENKLNDDEDRELLDTYDVFVTTYGMLTRNEWISKINWDNVIIDEAQAIKNAGTKQTKAVKKLKASFRVAMTGTPIENRLSDLWSLFDFLNKGLLGSTKEFGDFIKKIEKNDEGYNKLKNVVSPFIIRRLKTDKSIITDLPDKIEMKVFATLTKKQASIYQALVDELIIKIKSIDDGIEKKGLVLSSIMKFKQICNHPDQYLGQDVFAENESGKYNRLREICETIYEKRERVLIFTQFKSITEHLKTFLESIFEHEGLVLHGGTPIGKRKDIVEKFQGQDYVPFLVLSIKAGGVGLNLTKANHVIHFDRWWNPAVENQATDRAFRIGQKKNVIVHKFITKGTIEEKIDLMIDEKVKLQNDIVPGSQEKWITELENTELINLFKLSI